MRTGLGLWIALVLVVSCGNNGERVTREQCAKVADHVANLIIDHYVAHPDEFWDGITAEPGDPGLPTTVTKQTFKAYLDSPEGRTWLLQRRGQARTGTEQGIDGCVKNAKPKQVRCLLAAKSRDDVSACDQAK
jgi:hypothetical protein